MPRLLHANAVLISLALLCSSNALIAQDTIIVRADNPPVWGDNLRLIEESRLGELEGDEEYVFGHVGAVAVNSDGVVYVADEQATLIRCYGPDGRFIRNIGGKGQGPGEFIQISGMSFLPNGELATWDARNLRISVFDSEGDFSRSVRVTGLSSTRDPLQADTAGHFYLSARVHPPPRTGEDAEERWIHLSPSGGVVDSIPIPLDHPPSTSYVLATVSGHRRPFTESTISALSPHGYLIVGRNTEYSLNRPLRDGRVLRIERSFDPVPVGPDEKAQWEAWSEHFMELTLPGVTDSGLRRHYPPIPDHKPAFRGLWVDQEGRIWVYRYVEARYHPPTPEELADRQDRPRPLYEWREPPVWDVIDPRGTFLGSLETPDNGWIAAARGFHIWVVERGEFDEEYVVRYRIERG